MSEDSVQAAVVESENEFTKITNQYYESKTHIVQKVGGYWYLIEKETEETVGDIKYHTAEHAMNSVQ